MELTLEFHPVTAIRFGEGTHLEAENLIVDKNELRGLVLEDGVFESVNFEIARPGESCRAGPVFDIVEPRAKAPGGSPDWPGILSAPQTAGFGTTHVLSGAAVTLVNETSPGESRGATGYVLEMSGAPAAGSHYATLNHLIIIPHTKAGLPAHARLKSYRTAHLKVAVHLGRAGFGVEPERKESLETSDGVGRVGLPRVAYIGQVFSRQRTPEPGERILYGATTDGMLPTLLHPNEWLDGAVAPSYHCSLGGAESYFYQNHPVIMSLYRRHRAQELNFAGCVVTIASADNFDRERNCRFAANLVKWALRADAAVLTKFGGGVPHTDLSETARLLETTGVKTAVQVTDLARDHRVESALLFNFPEVNAIVCIGGNDTRWKLPRVEHVIAANSGMAELLAGPFEIESLNVIGVANQQGASRLRSMVY
ncbi:MAG TPA: glycine/sarcosine/betaine reductase component B subunit [Candidatus Binatia bacterium]|nr:glycine/sarcosine/betaine reductase component B subunit [Candidatus Binatia bacterium]